MLLRLFSYAIKRQLKDLLKRVKPGYICAKVTAKPLGRSLLPEHQDLFRPLSEQPSLKSITRKEKFKMKHIGKGLKLQNNLGR